MIMSGVNENKNNLYENELIPLDIYIKWSMFDEGKPHTDTQ